MIDLMAVAKKVSEIFIDVENSLVGTIRIYHVPDALLMSIGNDLVEPELPMVRMKTATGFQERSAKTGDKEFNDYQQAKSNFNAEKLQLRIAAGSVNAVRDVDWSKYDLSKPPAIDGAIEMYANGNWPDSELLRKKAWLDWTILFRRSDQGVVLDAISTMNGENEPTDEMVEEVKKNSV